MGCLRLQETTRKRESHGPPSYHNLFGGPTLDHFTPGADWSAEKAWHLSEHARYGCAIYARYGAIPVPVPAIFQSQPQDLSCTAYAPLISTRETQ